MFFTPNHQWKGRLVKGGKEPQNVQVVLHETAEGVTVCLADEDGTFLEVPQSETETVEDRTIALRNQLAEKLNLHTDIK